MSQTIQIYKFTPGEADGKASMKDIIGGKGANLAEMASIGLPVPPGFTIPCSASIGYKLAQSDSMSLNSFSSKIAALTTEGLEYLEGKFGYMPLLSVRSGARVSMPGMMDTILNVGLTTETLPFWSDKIGKRPALDSYRRLIQMYSSVALDVPMAKFDEALDDLKESLGVATDSDLTAEHLTRLIKRYNAILAEAGVKFPDTLEDQLTGAIYAVFSSWDNPRAVEYRKINSIPYDWGTAVTVQSMVFGNVDDNSATGVVFTRDPSTGAPKVTGEYLVNAQGEDVVAGIRTPESLGKLAGWNKAISKELHQHLATLEELYADMQDVEFTVQSGKLYLLQTRNGKRSAQAAFRIAHDLACNGMISKLEASKRVTVEQLYAALQDRIDPSFKTKPTGVGIAAGGGIVSGVAMLTAESAVNCTVPCILVTKETNPDDIAGMNAAQGILTATGGLTSHAAVVARGMNKTCVVGTTSMQETEGDHFLLNGYAIQKGTPITIDGSTGNIWVGVKVPLIAGGPNEFVKQVISWRLADECSDRIELSATMKETEVYEAILASNSKVVYIDAITLEGSDCFSFSHNEALYSRVKAMYDALVDSAAGQRAVVHFSTRADHYSSGDGVFDFMFGASELASYEVQALSLFISMNALPNVVVSLSERLSDLASKVKSVGWSVMGSVSTVADLMNGGGEVTQDVIAKVFGTKEAYEFVKAAVEAKLGKKLTTAHYPPPRYWYEALVKGA